MDDLQKYNKLIFLDISEYLDNKEIMDEYLSSIKRLTIPSPWKY